MDSAVDLLEQLLRKMPEVVGASDLHISAMSPPSVRVNGLLKSLKMPALPPEKTQDMIFGILTAEQRARFEKDWNLDFCYQIEGVGRYRANVLKQRLGIDATFRYIPLKVPTAADLNLSENVVKLAYLHQGLVLVTGPTRSGKTATLAALIQAAAEAEPLHILTVEDPIEYVFPVGKSLINQREVGKHTESTAAALRAALREDPDVIMVGEMRDLETIQLAISAAETGHLVISTLQTQSAAKTIDRIVDSFPPNQTGQIRAMLSESLRGVVSQQLLRRADNKGMVLAGELLLSTVSLSNLIRDGKTFQIPSILQTGASIGMKRMDDAISELLWAGTITKEEALRMAYIKKDIQDKPPEKKKNVQPA